MSTQRMLSVVKDNPSDLVTAVQTVARELALQRHEAKRLLKQLCRVNPGLLQLRRKEAA